MASEKQIQETGEGRGAPVLLGQQLGYSSGSQLLLAAGGVGRDMAGSSSAHPPQKGFCFNKLPKRKQRQGANPGSVC